MAATKIQLGILSRAQGSVVVESEPNLNIEPGHLSKGGISLGFSTPGADNWPTNTGYVVINNLYQIVELTIQGVRSQNKSLLYQQRFLVNVQLGQVTVYPDTVGEGTLEPYILENCYLDNIEPQTFSGSEGTYNIRIIGTMPINSATWSGAQTSPLG